MAKSVIIRTKMADAMVHALHSCVAENRNPGRVGRHILTADSRGVGQKYRRTERTSTISAK